MSNTPPTLKAQFDELTKDLIELKAYDEKILESAETARDGVIEAQGFVENIIGNHEWFYKGNEKYFDLLLQCLTMATVVCDDLERHKIVLDQLDSSDEAIEEAETSIAFRRDNFKEHLDSALGYLDKLYERGRVLAGQWEIVADFKSDKDKVSARDASAR